MIRHLVHFRSIGVCLRVLLILVMCDCTEASRVVIRKMLLILGSLVLQVREGARCRLEELLVCGHLRDHL